MENETQEQSNNRPWLYKKGQSGNPGGRPVGSKSMKTWLKERLASMSDEEREEFIEGINKIDLFKMAEGNPDNKTDLTTNGEAIKLSPELVKLKEDFEKQINNLLDNGTTQPR